MNVIFTDAQGNEKHYSKQIYDLKYSNSNQGGPLTAEITIPIDLIKSHQILEDVHIYDGIGLVWCGRVFETPRVTQNRQAAVINALGHVNHLTDQSFKRLYSDVSYNAWDTNPPVAPNDDWAWEKVEKDNNNRLFLKFPNGEAVVINTISETCYLRAHPTSGVNQDIYSITFDYTTGSSYNSANFQLVLHSYSTEFYVDDVAEWTLAGSGALSGSVTEVITASKKCLSFRLQSVAGFTPADENYWAKITNIRVNGLSGFTGNYQADEIIKDFLTNYCPKISTDQTLIDTGTYTLPEFFVESKQSPLDVLKELNKYENFNYGVWNCDVEGSPIFSFEAHDLTTVHYTTSLKYAKPDLSGESLENQFNSVDVEYNNPAGNGKLTVTRTATHSLLDAEGITRSPLSPIQVDTTSSAAANQVGDTFLDDRARRQGKGSIVVVNNLKDSNGVDLPVTHLRAGKNILIRDLEPTIQTLTDMTSSNVLNGKNIFKIVQVDIDAKAGSATLQLDSDGNRLDLLLSRKGF